MSFLDKLFQRKPKNTRPAPTLSGWLPFYPQLGTNIYYSDAVQQALKCIVDEIKKLNPTHVRKIDNDAVPVKGSTVQDVLNDPNPIMTTSEFLEKICWLLLLNYNAFVVPIYRVWIDPKTKQERRYYEQLLPIKPTQANIIEDASGKLFIQFWFMDGSQTTLRYEDVIHIKYNYSVNAYMGGDEAGQPDNKALLQTLQMNDELLKGIAKAMKASYAVNGILKYNTLLDDGSMEQKIREFEQKLENSDSGILGLDLKGDFTPFEKRAEIVGEDTLRFIDEKILRNWGVPISILTGDFNKEQYEAFYQKALEPLIISISQAFTKRLFTSREKAFGNRVELYPRDLIFMTVSQTIEMIKELSPTGALYENEKRTALGLPPLPELEGQRYMSLNWIDAKNAEAYQVGLMQSGNLEVIDEEKEDV
jgi:HK97 family phage portal protein